MQNAGEVESRGIVPDGLLLGASKSLILPGRQQQRLLHRPPPELVIILEDDPHITRPHGMLLAKDTRSRLNCRSFRNPWATRFYPLTDTDAARTGLLQPGQYAEQLGLADAAPPDQGDDLPLLQAGSYDIPDSEVYIPEDTGISIGKAEIPGLQEHFFFSICCHKIKFYLV